MAMLPIGTRYGCLTIVGDYSIYKEIKDKRIEELRLEKKNYIEKKERGEYVRWIQSSKWFDDKIKCLQEEEKYKCRCKCGNEFFITEQEFLQKRHRFCEHWDGGRECGLRERQKTRTKRATTSDCTFVKGENYDINFTNTFHESLEILECVDDKFERNDYVRTKKTKVHKIYKRYRCKCYLCGNEQYVDCSQFYIKPPDTYGVRAFEGYYSGAYCTCHEHSSFQWIVNKVLKDHNVSYRVEKTFPRLYGSKKIGFFAFDFAILDEKGEVEWLIECQGEQHYKPVEKFGGVKQFEEQKKNDELKRQYANGHGIKLLEISYKDKKEKRVEEILKENGIISEISDT